MAFDLALIDWNMPVMDGLQMLTELRARGFTSIKILMVTTEAENDFIIRALDAGADEYLMKPFDEVALDEKLCHARPVGDLNELAPSPHQDPDCR